MLRNPLYVYPCIYLVARADAYLALDGGQPLGGRAVLEDVEEDVRQELEVLHLVDVLVVHNAALASAKETHHNISQIYSSKC